MRRNRIEVLFSLVVLVLPSLARGDEPAQRRREVTADEAQVAHTYEALIEDQLVLLDDDAAEQAVSRIAGKLGGAAAIDREHPLRVRIVIDPTPNVFSGPAGSLYVTTGLLDVVGSESELAAVLAPEVADAAAGVRMSEYRDKVVKKFVTVTLLVTAAFAVEVVTMMPSTSIAGVITPHALPNTLVASEQYFTRSMLGMATSQLIAGPIAQGTTGFGKVEDPASVLADQIAALHHQRERAQRLGRAQDADRLQRQIEQLDLQRQELISLSREIFPEYAAIKYPTPLGAGELDLQPREALLRFDVRDRQVLRWLIQGGKVQSFKAIEMSSGILGRKVESYLRGLKNVYQQDPDAEDLAVGKELYRVLLGDLAPQLEGGVRVFVAANGALAKLPFEALVEGWDRVPGGKGRASRRVRYVGDRLGLTYAYSGSSLTGIRKRATRQAAPQKSLLVVGVADFSPPPVAAGGAAPPQRCTIPDGTGRPVASWAQALALPGQSSVPDLEVVGPFVQQVGGLFGDSVRLVDQGASEAALRKEHFLGQFRYVAFATHGTAGSPPYLMESGLLLSPRGADLCDDKNDGLLAASEIMDLSLASDAVLLTACDTAAATAVVSGEGTLSVARAFQAAGAKSVLASLWPVHPASAVLFSKQFVSYLSQGKSRLEAFRLARQDLRAGGYPQTGHWAPFILIGEP